MKKTSTIEKDQTELAKALTETQKTEIIQCDVSNGRKLGKKDLHKIIF